MIRIRPGKLLEDYAICFGVCDEFGRPDMEAMLEWVNNYVNGPWEGEREATEKERLESIRGYISAMVNDSVTRRIKASIEQQEKAA